MNSTGSQFVVFCSQVLNDLRLNRKETTEMLERAFSEIEKFIDPEERPHVSRRSSSTRARYKTVGEQISWLVPYRFDNHEPAWTTPKYQTLKEILLKVPGNPKADPQWTPVFPGYTSLLSHIKAGTVSLSQLKRGLFCFGCTQSHVDDLLKLYKLPLEGYSGNERDWVDEDPRVGAMIQVVIMVATRLATQEGRAIWRSLDECMDFEKVNQLLLDQGFQPVKTTWGDH